MTEVNSQNLNIIVEFRLNFQSNTTCEILLNKIKEKWKIYSRNLYVKGN